MFDLVIKDAEIHDGAGNGQVGVRADHKALQGRDGSDSRRDGQVVR